MSFFSGRLSFLRSTPCFVGRSDELAGDSGELGDPLRDDFLPDDDDVDDVILKDDVMVFAFL